LDQLINYLSDPKSFFPWISFLAGLGGSLHCVGMCGGLVTASCGSTKTVFRYQLGRLLGYLFLGLLAGLIGSTLGGLFDNQWPSVLGAVLMGCLFIFWGLSNFRGKKAEIPTPRFLRNIYQKLWVRLIKDNEGVTRSFFVGLISIMLPCGLLYGMALGTLALKHTHEALFSMFFFWLGTLPAMMVAPVVVQKILNPLKAKLPKVYAVGLISIGLLTIYSRLPFSNPIPTVEATTQEKVHKCH
jgi:sulfite exporter TauE/SafE